MSSNDNDNNTRNSVIAFSTGALLIMGIIGVLSIVQQNSVAQTASSDITTTGSFAGKVSTFLGKDILVIVVTSNDKGIGNETAVVVPTENNTATGNASGGIVIVPVVNGTTTVVSNNNNSNTGTEVQTVPTTNVTSTNGTIIITPEPCGPTNCLPPQPVVTCEPAAPVQAPVISPNPSPPMTSNGTMMSSGPAMNGTGSGMTGGTMMSSGGSMSNGSSMTGGMMSSGNGSMGTMTGGGMMSSSGNHSINCDQKVTSNITVQPWPSLIGGGVYGNHPNSQLPTHHHH